MANGKSTFFDADDKQVKTDKDISGAYRAMCTGDTSHLSDAQVAAIVKAVHGDGTDVDVQDKRVKAVEAARPSVETHSDAHNKPVTPNPAGLKTVSAGIPQRIEAIKFGRMIGADFVKAWDKAIDGKDDWEGGPIILEVMAEKTWGKAAIAAFPVPGSGTKAWLKEHPGANGPFDHYEIDAVGGKISSSFCKDMVNNTAVGERLALRNAQLQAVIDNTTHLADTPQSYIDAYPDKDKLAAWKNTLNTKHNNYVKKLAQTIRVLQQRYRIAEQLPLVGVMFANQVSPSVALTETQRDITSKMTLPFVIYDASTPGGAKTKPFSVGTFLRLNVAEAAAKQGTVTDLWSTVKRAPKAKGDTTAPGATGTSAEGLDVKVTNIKEFDTSMSALVNYMENDALMTMTHHGIQKKSDDVFPRLQNMFAMRGLIEGFCMKYEELYETLRVEREAAVEAAKTKAA